MTASKTLKRKVVEYTTNEPVPLCWTPNAAFYKEWRMLVKDGKTVALVEAE